MIDLAMVEMCAGCKSDLATAATSLGTPLCLTCYRLWRETQQRPTPLPAPEQQARLWAWAEAHGWPRLELYPYLAVAKGEQYWRVFVDHPANAQFWPVALERIGA